MTKFLPIFLLLLPFSLTAKKYEKDYQDEWCQNVGKTEVVLPDRTRVDCMTATHAIEFDWGKKWAEAIGQSLYYSFQTNKKPGIVLILAKPDDMRYFHRLESVNQHYKLGIKVWIVKGY